MLKIYGSDLSGPSNKVRFAANALGVKYEYIKINLREGEHKKEEFLKLHPAGKIPVIDDGGFILFESNAIIKYIAGKAKSDLYPADLMQRAIVDQWMDFSSLHVAEGVYKVVHSRVFGPRRNLPVNEQVVAEGLGLIERFFPIVDRQMEKNKYISGSRLTLADINLLAILDPLDVAGIEITKYKNLKRWFDNLRKESFYTRCHKEYGESLKA